MWKHTWSAGTCLHLQMAQGIWWNRGHVKSWTTVVFSPKMTWKPGAFRLCLLSKDLAWPWISHFMKSVLLFLWQGWKICIQRFFHSEVLNDPLVFGDMIYPTLPLNLSSCLIALVLKLRSAPPTLGVFTSRTWVLLAIDFGQDPDLTAEGWKENLWCWHGSHRGRSQVIYGMWWQLLGFPMDLNSACLLHWFECSLGVRWCFQEVGHGGNGYAILRSVSQVRYSDFPTPETYVWEECISGRMRF